ncbi:hypothetical protein GCM10022252_24190 [Streptosporangium oxazolinicum]|uniref:Uncharacterized protein n=1 Tax=Streptosporangium oxazolinicum TaxID=909287 RepID=A0ABP8ARC2_9ACTN
MGTYAVTGSASGMGAAVTERLRSAGHSVIDVDLRDADLIADLATPQGRSAAAAGILERSGGVLDGAVVAAGIGPRPLALRQLPRYLRRWRAFSRPSSPDHTEPLRGSPSGDLSEPA